MWTADNRPRYNRDALSERLDRCGMGAIEPLIGKRFPINGVM